MDHLATRCPNCATSFQITRELLQTANGSVRCGSCLNVFNAEEHQMAQGETQSLSNPHTALDLSAQPTTTSPDINAKSNENINDSFQAKEISQPTYHHELTRRPPSIEIEEVDESWAEALLAELDTEDIKEDSIPPVLSNTAPPNTYTKPHADLDISEAFSDLDDKYVQNKTIPKPEEEETKELTDTPIPAIPSLINEQNSPTDSDENTNESIQEELEVLSNNKPITNNANVDRPSNSTNVDTALTAPPSKEDILSHIEPEPIQVHWEQNTRSALGNFAWGLLTIVAILGIAAQYAVYNTKELSREESYRPYYVLACQYFPCTLPDQTDLSKIRSNNLIVRTHPKLPRVLVVDTIIVNDAIFKQYFPRIQLIFSDINGATIASRTFSPTEYLGGELTGENQMPTQQPIHLSLEIVDPGSKAINYRLKFKPFITTPS